MHEYLNIRSTVPIKLQNYFQTCCLPSDAAVTCIETGECAPGTISRRAKARSFVSIKCSEVYLDIAC